MSEALLERDHRLLPTNSLVITIDDGHRRNFKLLPLIQKYKIVPTIYVCTQIVRSNRRFWWTADSKKAEVLKKLSNAERLSFLRRECNFIQEAEFDGEPQALSAIEISEMKNHVDFQSHTRFHPILPKCTDEESKAEIKGSSEDMKKFIGRGARHFAFPNGSYCERDVTFVKEAGYRTARTTDVGWTALNSDPFKLKTVGCLDGIVSCNRLASILCCAPHKIKTFLGKFNWARSKS